MKKIIICIFVGLVIIIGIVLVKNQYNHKYDYKIEEISDFKYYIYKDNNQYGVIDSTGKTVIEANYNNVIIPNPSRSVFVCYLNEKAEILNEKKEKLFNQYEDIEPIKLKNVASTLAYEKSVLKYKKDNKYGLIDFDGNVITNNIYDSIENLQPTEGKFLVKKNNKAGVIDLKGNRLVDTEYDQCESDEFYSDESGYNKSGFIILNKMDDGYKYGYISYNGKKILNVKYNDIERVLLKNEKDLYLIVSENGKYGLYKNTKKLIENDYQEIVYDENVNLLMLQKNKKYGVATLEGNIIIDVNCEQIDSRGNYLYVTESGNNKVYDTKANIVNINFNASIYNTKNEDYKISTILNNNITYYGIIDKNDNKLVEEKYRYLEYLYKNYFIAINEQGNIGVINSNGKEVLEMKYIAVQKLQEKNIVQAMNNNGISEFYSYDMNEVLKMENPVISIQNDYVIISNSENKKYLDNNGVIIKDISSLAKENYPDQIGEYRKEKSSIEHIYYVSNK